MDNCENCAVKYLAEFSKTHDLPWKIGKDGWLYHTNRRLDTPGQAHDYDNLMRRVKKEEGKRNFAKTEMYSYGTSNSVVPKVRRYWDKIGKFAEEFMMIRMKHNNGRCCGGIA